MKQLLLRLLAMLARAHKSATLWFNSAAAAAVIFLPDLQTQLPQLQEYIGADLYKRIMAIVIIGNILLRFKTTKALDQK